MVYIIWKIWGYPHFWETSMRHSWFVTWLICCFVLSDPSLCPFLGAWSASRSDPADYGINMDLFDLDFGAKMSASKFTKYRNVRIGWPEPTITWRYTPIFGQRHGSILLRCRSCALHTAERRRTMCTKQSCTLIVDWRKAWNIGYSWWSNGIITAIYGDFNGDWMV